MHQPNLLLNQLLQDESFVQWVDQSDPAAMAYWDAWIAAHPGQQETVEMARRMVKGIVFTPQHLSLNHINDSLTQVQERLFLNRPNRTLNSRWFYAAAALAGLLIGTLAWWVWYSYDHRPAYVTSYGEMQDFVLPDGSHVTLNAHSSLRYQALTDPVRREVFLEGEAFFSIVGQGDDQPTPFIVHTRDLAVQVIGTEFNVNTRRGRTQVVLDEGKVALQLPTHEIEAMVPGELVEYQLEDSLVHKETVDPKLFTLWCDRKLKFDDTPLSEVALMLEENYGVAVTFDDPALRTRPVTGEISARKLDTILNALSKLFSINIQQSGNTILISKIHVTP